jgi:acetylornithine deacetylase
VKSIDVAQLTLDLVSIPSVNPDLAAGEGELSMMTRVGEILEGIGISTEVQPVEGGRANIIGTLPGTAPGTLVLEAHLDTVPMPTEPCGPSIHHGRVWGRGSCDTKSSVAAMLGALQTLSSDGRPRPTVLFAGVVDEEYVMRGAHRLVERVVGVDGIIVGEPTNLLPVRAHNGCVRFEIRVHGITAHSSKAFLGRNALIDAARLLLALEDELGAAYVKAPHAMTGPGLLTATEILGGTAPNVVPESCVVRFDRRLTPAETAESALASVDQVIARMRDEHGINATRTAPWLSLPSVETAEDDPLTRAAEDACSDTCGAPTTASGVPYCTDANVLTGLAHVPSVVVGPGSIDQAHAPVEWVEVHEVEAAVSLYASMVRRMAKPESEEDTR